MQRRVPRLVLAGTNSGCGKTTVSCAVLQSLVRRGLQVGAALSVVAAVQGFLDFAPPVLPEKGALVRIGAARDRAFCFYYEDSLAFSGHAVQKAIAALRAGCDIVTDTQMAKAGINKTILASLGGEVHCFMSDADVAAEAKERGVTRAFVSMERAAALPKPCIFAIGNAPTALFSLEELMEADRLRPALIIGIPVGFVNVVESKERIIKAAAAPYIVSRGRKGGSNMATAICNAMLYQIRR